MYSLIENLDRYLRLRRSLGYKLMNEERMLRSFIRFLDEKKENNITVALALEWAQLPKDVQRSWQSKRLTVVRLFSQYLIAYAPKTEVSEKGLLKANTSRKTPFIYSDNQISTILNACLKEKTKGLRHLTYFTFFGLLAVTGCRIGELINLKVNHVNWKYGILEIRDSKFGKSRYLPISPSTKKQLSIYLEQRCRFGCQPGVVSYFISELGMPLTVNGVEIFFVRLSKNIGLREKDASSGPRIHDLRHTFAVKTIIDWYKSDNDVHQVMPLLSTYLGHKKPSDTYWYLSHVPELMFLAMERLELKWGA